ncbi:MAG: hypothetical protein FWF28_10110, partial [Micrococcales bacterium]|nr:hypothetical protein [Micrococcales bacterium]
MREGERRAGDATRARRRGGTVPRPKVTARRATAATTGATVAVLVLGLSSLVGGCSPDGAAPHVSPTAALPPTATATPATAATATPAPSPAAQEPRSVGTGEVATLGDLEAVNHPDMSDSTSYLTRDVAGLRVTVNNPDPSALGATVGITLAGSSGKPLATAGYLTWASGDSESDYTWPGSYPSSLGPSFVRYDDAAVWEYLAAIVPSWLRDPRAYLVSRSGWTLPDGTTTHLAEAPTFRAPSPDGRLMLLVAASGPPTVGSLLDGTMFVVFTGDAGQPPVIPDCFPQTPTQCDLANALPAGWLTGTPARFTPNPSPEPSPRPTPNPHATPSLAAPTAATTSAACDRQPTGPLVALVPQVFAATGPGKTASCGQNVSFGPFGGATVQLVRDGTDSDSLIELGGQKDNKNGAADVMEIPNKAFIDGPGPFAQVATFNDPTDGCFAYGFVPPDMPGARVFYVNPKSGFVRADGTTT